MKEKEKKKSDYSCMQIKCFQLKSSNFHAGCLKQLPLLSSLIIINPYHFTQSRAALAVSNVSHLDLFIYLF